MKKRLISVLLIVSMLFVIGTPAFAAQGDTQGTIEPQADGYTYWEINSIVKTGETVGDWEEGPDAVGPYTIAKTVSVTVENTFSGSYYAKPVMEAEFGVEFGVEYTESTYGELEVPSGHKYRMIYAPYYSIYEVTEYQYHRIDGYTSKIGERVSYVTVFEDITFDKQIIY